MIPRPKPETPLEQWLDEQGHPFSRIDRKRIWHSYGPSEQYLPEKSDEVILNALKADAEAPEPKLVSSGPFDAGSELEIRFPDNTMTLKINSQLREGEPLEVERGNKVSLGTIKEPGICTARVVRNEGQDDEIIRDLMVVVSKGPDQKFNAELVTAPRAQIEKPLSNGLRVDFTDKLSSGWKKLQDALTKDFVLIGKIAEYVAKKWAPENAVALSHTAIVCTVAVVPVALSQKKDCVVMGIGNGISVLIDSLVFATEYLSKINDPLKKINIDEKKALDTMLQGIKGAYEGISLLVGGAKLRKKGSSNPDKLCDLAKLLVGSGNFATGLVQKTTDAGEEIQLATGILGQSVGKTVDLICLSKGPTS